MSKLCIIPARGGSKRIPRKNIRDFWGKPIIAYSIEAALQSGLFDKVMVSTDDEEIAGVSVKYGAEVPFMRSASTADDFATTADVLAEVLKKYENEGISFEYACCCYATAPFTTAQRLAEGFNKLITENADSVFPISAFSYPIFRSFKRSDDGRVGMIWPENLNKRSQDFPEAFHDAGQWYWFVVDRFLKSGQLFTNNSIGLEISTLEVQDIDNEHDWHLAELKYGYLQSIK
ncbi:pseudaminic acid cytidylyltransferase [Cecembia calidifontis]|uniref:N-acylneuraminate cytidylyltransferase n=1 Tax=Cecembia calidifontis TaxID=1187080 RepID=A0A4Q7PD33_9BACT|nr:pseudaminic acid cytidylyltransferase [Cecembia calidifontis]RZS98264.1 N-acylneuraminate cytidylyltransferase [Cecembia calidifontis]